MMLEHFCKIFLTVDNLNLLKYKFLDFFISNFIYYFFLKMNILILAKIILDFIFMVLFLHGSIIQMTQTTGVIGL